MIFVADTHSFLWYLSEDKRLGKMAKEKFDLAEKGHAIIGIPTIVLAETLHILEKKHFDIKFKDIIEKLETGWNFRPIPLDLRVIKIIAGYKKLVDIHDRIIAASAFAINAELITKDENIKKSNYVKTIW